MVVVGARLPAKAVLNRRVVVRAVHGGKSGIVFLGTPNVAANLLGSLLEAAAADCSTFEVVGVVTQPPAVRGRGRKPSPSLVAQRALDRDFPPDRIFSPEKAGEHAFLEQMKSLRPDLCITAAYGNILPQKFLDIPNHGTVNVHPSLLPLYRGAAPVQRAVQDGVKVTGVTVAYTVRALDSGPIVASESVEVDDNIKAPDLQDELFAKGTKLLLRELPYLLNGSAKERATEQDHSRATFAPKISVDESWLSFEEPALVLHNKVRAFAEWPGTKAKLKLCNSDGTGSEILEMKIVTTNVSEAQEDKGDEFVVKGGSLVVKCGANSWLEILEVQPQGRKVMRGRDYWNGLKGKQLFKWKETRIILGHNLAMRAAMWVACNYQARTWTNVPETMDRSMFVFGLGYTGIELGKRLVRDGWKVSGTCRSVEKKIFLKDKYGIEAHIFCPNTDLGNDGLEALCGATHLVSCVPPDTDTGSDLVLKEHRQDIEKAAQLHWIGYISSTGVYGDHQGGWVDESSEAKPVDRKAEARLQTETAWLQLLQSGLSVQIFRVGGIYGPGRSVLDSVRGGKSRQKVIRDARRFTSRVHVADICQVIIASTNSPNPGTVYNVADDDPAPRSEAVAFAKRLLGMDHNEFELEQQVVAEKRVSNRLIKEELGVKLIYPSYREGLTSIHSEELQVQN